MAWSLEPIGYAEKKKQCLLSASMKDHRQKPIDEGGIQVMETTQSHSASGGCEDEGRGHL